MTGGGGSIARGRLSHHAASARSIIGDDNGRKCTGSRVEKIVELFRWVIVHRRDFVYRVVVSLLFASWLALFPRYVLTLYLGERGIPPFELMSEDLPGAHVLLAWTVIVLLIGGLYLWLPLILAILRRFYVRDPAAALPTESPPSKVAQVIWSRALRNAAWILSALLLGLLLLLTFGAGSGRWVQVFYFAATSLVFVLSLFLLIRRNMSDAIINWKGPLVFIGLSIALPIAFQSAFTSLLDATLRRFRVGGLIPAQVELLGGNGATRTISGKLLLLGRRNIYLEQGEGEARTLIVIANTQNIVLSVRQEAKERDL